MVAARWFSFLLLALAAASGAALWLQRQAAAERRDEIARLRDEHRQLAGLRTENARLTAAQPPAAELERLRTDHAAVIQLRGEIERLRTRLETRERALAASTAPRPQPTAAPEPETAPEAWMWPAGKWKDAGSATPLAAFETFLWAGSTGHVDQLSTMLALDDGALARARAMLEELPAAARENYASPYRLLAELMAKDMPVGDTRVFAEKTTDPNPTNTVLRAELRDPDGSIDQARFELQKIDDRWLVRVRQELVEHLAADWHKATAK